MRSLPIFTAAWLLLGAARAWADPGYYVVTAYDNPGVRTVDLRYWTVSKPNAKTVIWPEIGLGWNVNGRWYTELLASWIGTTGSDLRLSTLNWRNDVLLTRGQYPFDLAVHVQVVHPHDRSEPRAIEFGPVLQTDIGRTQLNANLFFERESGAGARPTQLKYQWQVRHRWRPGLHVGAQGFGEPGRWDRFSPRSAQSHRAGPALFGRFDLGERRLNWQAAWLGGSTYGRHGHMLSVRATLDF